MKNYKTTQRKGLVTILNTVVIGGFMLGVMTVVYQASIRSMEGQKNAQLKQDYEAREQAFLRSVVTLAPLHAANTMIDGGTDTFRALYKTAIDWSDMREALSDDDLKDLFPGVSESELDKYGSGNAGDLSKIITNGTDDDFIKAVVGASAGTAGDTVSSIGSAGGGNLPAKLKVRTSAAGGVATNSTKAPLISSDITNAADTESSGALRSYASVAYPDIHFGYTRGTFVARQNWWELDVHANAALAGVSGITGLGGSSEGNNKYVLSLYEVPSQLAISSSAITNLGLIDGSTYDTNKVKFNGSSIYAKKAVVGSGSSLENLSTTSGVTTEGGATIGGASVAGSVTAGTLRDTAATTSMTSNAYYPISRASDYARSMFIPINPGLEFFDRFASTPTTGARKSKDHWFEYTRGCHQCAMELIVLEVDGSTGVPISIALKFIASNNYPHVQIVTTDLSRAADVKAISENIFPANQAFYFGAQAWSGTNFPFDTGISADGNPMLEVQLNTLQNWVADKDGSVSFDTNHSLLVNVDYSGNASLEPQWGDTATDSQKDGNLAIGLTDCKDLTEFGKGFSLVTNFRLYILDNLNEQEHTAADQSAGFPVSPPLSVFAPSVRFGDNSLGSTIKVDGQLGSLNRSSSGGVNILDLKKGGATKADATSIEADLKAITAVNQLPPINVMNWLIVVQKQ